MNIKFPIRVKEKLHNNPTTTNFFIYFNVHRKIHTYDRVLKNIESWKTSESTYRISSYKTLPLPLTKKSSETSHFSIMKKLWDLKNVFSNLELEEQGRGIIMGVTRLLLIGPFYTKKDQFYVLFCTRLYLNGRSSPWRKLMVPKRMPCLSLPYSTKKRHLA